MSKFQLTKTAANQIKILLEKEKPNSIFRISILGGGCSGFQYDFSFCEKICDDDVVLNEHNVQYIIDKTSFEFISNGKLDFVNELGGSYFKIENPNSKANCGCGTSFSI